MLVSSQCLLFSGGCCFVKEALNSSTSATQSSHASTCMQMRLQRGVLPIGHHQRTSALITQSIVDVQDSGAAAQERLNASLDSLVEQEAPWVWPALGTCSVQVSGVEFVVDISVAAHVVDRAYNLQPPESAAPCASSDVIIELVCKWLTRRLQRAPPDGLLDVAEVHISCLLLF